MSIFDRDVYGIPFILFFLLFMIFRQLRLNNQQEPHSQIRSNQEEPQPRVGPSQLAVAPPGRRSTGTEQEQEELARSRNYATMDDLAELYVEMGDLASAEVWWRRAISAAQQANDGHLVAYITNRLVETVLLPAKRKESARELLSAAIPAALEADADEPASRASLNLGILELELGNHAEAKLLLERADPWDAPYFLGLIAEASGDMGRARELWRSARRSPTRTYAKLAGKALDRTWEPQERDEPLLAVLQAVDPTSLNKAQQKALKDTLKMVRREDIGEDVVHAARMFGRKLLDAGRTAEARELLLGLAALDPIYADRAGLCALNDLMILEYESDNLEDSRILLDRIAKSDVLPRVDYVHGCLLLYSGYLLERSGDVKEARRRWGQIRDSYDVSFDYGQLRQQTEDAMHRTDRYEGVGAFKGSMAMQAPAP